MSEHVGPIAVSVAHGGQADGFCLSSPSFSEHQWSEVASRACADSLAAWLNGDVLYVHDDESRGTTLTTKIKTIVKSNCRFAVEIHVDDRGPGASGGPQVFFWGADAFSREVAAMVSAALKGVRGFGRHKVELPAAGYDRDRWCREVTGKHGIPAILVEAGAGSVPDDLAWLLIEGQAERIGTCVGNVIAAAMLKRDRERMRDGRSSALTKPVR